MGIANWNNPNATANLRTGAHDFLPLAAPMPIATENASTPSPTARNNIVNRLISDNYFPFLFPSFLKRGEGRFLSYRTAMTNVFKSL
jgi:hypothetical protein